MICSMSKLPELTAELSSNRSPKRFTLLLLKEIERVAGRPCRAYIRPRRQFFVPAGVRNTQFSSASGPEIGRPPQGDSKALRKAFSALPIGFANRVCLQYL
jgi:hypothetical protein